RDDHRRSGRTRPHNGGLKMNNGWFWVIAGGIVETVYTTFMGLAEGMTDLLYSALGFGLSIVGTLLLNQGLKAGLAMGASYAVWVGVGVAGAAVADILVFSNGLSILGYFFVALVLGGVVGLNLKTDKKAEDLRKALEES
ncbi:MAG: hypothetical protein II848_03860, partial [Candidatus Methanomethylophilus sp.]|nr:hypothetical protein [Methanomethylophilus sp.]